MPARLQSVEWSIFFFSLFLFFFYFFLFADAPKIMDANSRNYPLLSYVMSRLPSFGPSSTPHSDPSFVDLEQPPSVGDPSAASPSTHPPHIVHQMPHLSHPNFLASMTHAVYDVAQTRSLLRTLGPRSDRVSVDLAAPSSPRSSPTSPNPWKNSSSLLDPSRRIDSSGVPTWLTKSNRFANRMRKRNLLTSRFCNWTKCTRRTGHSSRKRRRGWLRFKRRREKGRKIQKQLVRSTWRLWGYGKKLKGEEPQVSARSLWKDYCLACA